MMKLAVLVLFMIVTVWASPQIYVAEPTKDFGIIEEGQTLFKNSFTIENRGTDTLRIQKVKPGCSCTIVDFPKTIAPGESGTISSSLKVKKSGNYNKSIKVFSNSKKNPILTLRLKVEILSIVNVNNRYLMMQEGEKGVYQGSLIVSSKEKGFTITDAKYKKRGDDQATPREVTYSLAEIPSIKESHYTKWTKKFQEFNDLKQKTLQTIFEESEIEINKPLSFYTQKLSKTKDGDIYDEVTLGSLQKSKEKLLKKYLSEEPTEIDLIHTSISEHSRLLMKDFALGYKKYRLDFTLMVELEYSEPGSFFFYTNVEQKKELKIPAILEPARNK